MEHVGTLLWEMRTEGGYSLGSLARKAGVSKAALSQWESGKRQPRVAELETVLDALGADAARRALLFARIEAPRALRHLRQTAPSQGMGMPATAGDLMRAMRQRKGWSQEQVAARLGVTRNAITQWESGDRMPSQEHLQALCYVLGAQEDEVVALTCGHFTQSSSTWEQTPEELRFSVERYWNGTEARSDLEHLSLITRTWRLAMREESARPLLARCYLMYADHLSFHQHWQEMGRFTRLALSLMPDRSSCEAFWVVGGIASAHHAVYAGSRPAPERGLNVLQRWLPLARDPIKRGWIQARMAEYLSLCGATEAAVAQGRQAIQTVEESGQLLERRRRCKDQGILLINAHCPTAALSLLQPDSEDAPAFALDLRLWQVKAYLALGEQAEAHTLLQSVEHEILRSQLHEMQPTVEALAQQC